MFLKYPLLLIDPLKTIYQPFLPSLSQQISSKETPMANCKFKYTFMGILFSFFPRGLFIVFSFAYVCHKLSHRIFVHTLLYFIIMSIFTLFSLGNSCGIFVNFDGRAAAAVDVSFIGLQELQLRHSSIVSLQKKKRKKL